MQEAGVMSEWGRIIKYEKCKRCGSCSRQTNPNSELDLHVYDQILLDEEDK